MSKRASTRNEQRAAELEAALGPASEINQRPEAVVTRIRRHGRILTLPVIVLLGTAFASGFFIGQFDEFWQNLVAILLALLLIIAGVLLPLSVWLGNTITVTTRRIIVRRGLLTRTRSEITLNRIREIRSRASIIQRMFRAGTVVLVTGTDAPTELQDIPAVNSVVDMLHELLDRTYVPGQTGVVPRAQTGFDLTQTQQTEGL